MTDNTPTPINEVRARAAAGLPVTDDAGQTTRVWNITTTTIVTDEPGLLVVECATTQGPVIRWGRREGVPFTQVMDGESPERVDDNIARAFVAAKERDWRRMQGHRLDAVGMVIDKVAQEIASYRVVDDIAKREPLASSAEQIADDILADVEQLALAARDLDLVAEHDAACERYGVPKPTPREETVFVQRMLEEGDHAYALAVGAEEPQS